MQTLPTHNILAASTSGRGVFEILLSDLKDQMEAPAPIKLPPRPAQLPNVVSYDQINDLILLPGRKPGQALVDARLRHVKDR